MPSDEARAGRPRSAWAVLPVVGYAVAAYLVTRHLWGDPGHVTVADNPDDATQAAWFLTWTPWALTHGHLPLFTDRIGAPDGVNLLWNTPVPLLGVLLAPLTALVGAAWVVTLLTALGPLLTATSGMCALRSLGALRLPAVLGGLVYGFSPAMTAKSLGHADLTMQPLLPWLLVLGVRLATASDRRRRRAVLLALLAAAQLLVDQELLLLSGLALALVLLVLLAARPGRLAALASAAPSYGLALAVFAVPAGPLLAFQLAGPRAGHGSPFTVSSFKADLQSYVVPSRLQLLAPAAARSRAEHFTGGITEQTAFLGWPLLLLALAVLVVLWRRLPVRACLLGALALSIGALGPELAVGGSDTGIVLPWAVVARLPVVQNALASRLPLLADLLLAAGLGLALDVVVREHRSRAPLAVAVLLVALLPALPAPLRARPVEPVPEFFTSAAAAGLAARGSVLVLPYPTGTETRPMRWQAAAGLAFRMPGGFFIGPADDGQLYVGGQPRASQALLADLAAGRPGPADPAAAHRQFLADLRFWGVGTVVLGPTVHDAGLAAFVSGTLGAAPVLTGGVQVWVTGLAGQR